MQWFSKKPKALLGIDIGAHTIKLIVLTKTANHPFVISAFAIKALPMMVLTDNNDIKDHATISATLTQLKNSGLSLDHPAAIALPGSSVVTKQILLDAHLDPISLEEHVWLEAGKYFPDLIEDLSLDFHVQDLNSSDNSKHDILLVACRKTSIEKRLEALTTCHIHVAIVDVDYYALERALRYMLPHQAFYHKEQAYALLNFNARSSTLVVIQGERLLYAYDQSFDGVRLLQNLTTEVTDQTVNLVDTTCISHIRHALQLFSMSAEEAPLDHLFLAGDFALIPTLADLVSERLTIPTSIANPLINMTIAASVDQAALLHNSPLLTLCCGLALHVNHS